MKINISYNQIRYAINISPTDNIFKIKQKICAAIGASVPGVVEYSGNSQTNLLSFQGTLLKDETVVDDIGLVSGNTLQYKRIDIPRYTLKINAKFLRRSIEFGADDIQDFEKATVGDVRVLLQDRIGIPMSIFYVTRVGSEGEIYDLHTLKYYNIQEQDELDLHLWKGTRGVIHAALQADISKTMSSLPSFHVSPALNRYLLRAVLFIAAHHDHTKLASLVLQRGVRCEEPVGEFCCRQWCSMQSHLGVFKTPIHQAAHMGSFQCLKMFVRHSPSSVITRDGGNRTPSNYASKFKKVACWKLLIASQFLHSRIGGFSLATLARIMKWCHKAKERVEYFRGTTDTAATGEADTTYTKHSLLLHSTLGKNNSTYLGNEIVVAGFNHGKLIKKCPCKHALHVTRPAVLSRRNTQHKLAARPSIIHVPQNSDERSENQISHSTERAVKLDSVENVKMKDKKNKLSKNSNTALELHNNLLPSIKQQDRQRQCSINKQKNLDDTSPEYVDSSKMNESCNREQESALSSAKFQDQEFKATLSKFLHKEQKTVQDIILRATGMNSKQLASECLQFGETFSSKPWLRQFDIALNSSRNRIRRGRPKTGLTKVS